MLDNCYFGSNISWVRNFWGKEWNFRLILLLLQPKEMFLL